MKNHAKAMLLSATIISRNFPTTSKIALVTWQCSRSRKLDTRNLEGQIYVLEAEKLCIPGFKSMLVGGAYTEPAAQLSHKAALHTRNIQ